MKNIRLILAILASVLLMSGPVLANSLPEDSFATPSSSQRELIIQECDNIKTHLGRIRSNDALMRVNLGQNYETISSRLMANLNTRIVANKLDGADLVTASAEFSENLDYFRENYQIYERELTRLTNMSCSRDASDFYEQLEIVRYYRRELNFNTTKIYELAEEYQVALDEFIRNLE